MNHDLSVSTRAAERYLLGELSGAERMAFEAHYFACEECAEEVRLGFEALENAKTVFGEDPAPKFQPPPAQRFAAPWARPATALPLAACLALLAIAGYENLVEIPGLRTQIASLSRPRALGPVLVLAPASRGSEPVLTASPAGAFSPIFLAVGAVPPAESYECDLMSAQGKVLLKIPVARLEPEANLTVLVPSADVPTGRYAFVMLAITAHGTSEVDRYPFAIRSE